MPPFVPNGFGAGTDNSAVGGSGGFTSYPQPPTGENAAFNPPENDLQAGAITFTSTAAMLVHFVLINPGRSA